MKSLRYIRFFTTWIYSLNQKLSNRFKKDFKPVNYFKRTRLVFFSFSFLLRFVVNCPAQAVIFNRVSPPEGSLFGMVNGISQDPQGYLWLATFGGGLHRYDGYRFITYMNNPQNPASLTHNDLQAVCADHNGIVWIGTVASGLDRLDPRTGTFTHYRHKKEDPESLTDDRITEILEDQNGAIWIGTMNGLNKLDPKTGSVIRFQQRENDPESLSCNYVQVLFEDRRGILWIGTGSPQKYYNSNEKGGLNRFNRMSNKFTRYLHNPKDSASLIDNRIGAVFEDSKGIFWVSTAREGLHIMDREKGKFKCYQYDQAHPENLSGPPTKIGVGLDLHLFFIREDGAGNIWIGSSGGWITRYDPATKRSTHFDSFNGDIQAMQATSGAYTSREGVLWITTWSGNIYKIDPVPNIIPHFSTGSIIHAVHEDASGILWLGTYGDGIIRLDRKTGSMKRFFFGSPDSSTLADFWVPAIYEGEDSTLWIGTVDKLIHYERKTKKIIKYINNPKDPTSLSKGNIVAISADQPGSLWIATSVGLDHFEINAGVFRHYRNVSVDSNSISNNEASALLKDHSGNLWIGTWWGRILNKFEPQTRKFRRFSCGSNIGTIIEDSENIIWVGTANGLYRSNPAVDSFSLFTDPRIAMTTATIVTSILEDNQKNLWVASSLGIIKINRKRNEISLFNKNQGVDATNLAYALMRGSKGRLGEFFFGDRTGYYAFFPDLYKSNTKPPQIVINDFILADQSVKAGKGSPISMNIAKSKEIHLHYNQNTFSFDFAGIHYSSPEDNQHLFKLENLDNSWRKAGPEKRAYYYNVPTGRYIFRVKAANRDGVWAEKAIIVIINPPWYRTWWAYLLYVLVFLAALGGFIKWRERTLRNEKVLLEKKVALRTHELQTEKEKVESTLSELKKIQEQLIESEKTAALSKLQQAMLNERLRISRELHDDIGGTLSGIVLYSHMAESQIKSQQVDEVQKSLNTIQQSANDMVNRLNDLVWAVNPLHNSLTDLMQKLEEYAKEMAIVKNISVKVDVSENLSQFQLPVESRHNIYLLCKEAINNAVKYSQASLLTLKVHQCDHVIEFKIMDNGKGFDTTTVKKGNGISNMRKRCDVMDTVLSMQSIPGNGTVISFQFKIT